VLKGWQEVTRKDKISMAKTRTRDAGIGPRFILHSNSLTERGDGVALFELALALRDRQVPVVVVFFAESSDTSQQRLHEFDQAGLTFKPYESRRHLVDICKEFHATHFLTFSDGTRKGNAYCSQNPDDFRIEGTVHVTWAVFRVWEPHGDFYLYVSRWNLNSNLWNYLVHELRRRSRLHGANVRVSFLEHFLRTQVPESANLLSRLEIPPYARVIGRIGGRREFSDPAARAAVGLMLQSFPTVYFIFVNTDPFIDHPRVRYLNSVTREEVWSFYASCDVLLNGRKMGESFGFGVVEAMRLGKPIVAPHRIRNWRMDGNHILLLRGLGLLYRNHFHLVKILARQLRRPVRGSSLQNRVRHTWPDAGMQKLGKLLGLPELTAPTQLAPETIV
jgi:hypothetical protein